MPNTDWMELVEKEKKDLTGRLILTGCGLNSIPPEINQMGWLKNIDLSNNQINKIENIGQLKELRTLNLINNNVNALENLETLNNLEDLYLNGNKISKIEGLNGCSELKALTLSNNLIEKIENVDSLKKLVVLYLSGNKITKIENLEGLTELYVLLLSQNSISRIENIDELVELDNIELNNNRIGKIENLHTLKKLRKINLSENQISKLENISALTELRGLDLYNNNIQKIEGLDSNLKLEFLGLSNNNLSKLEGLSQLKNLKNLMVGHNEITDLAELGELTELKRVILSGNKIESLQPMREHIAMGLPVSFDYSYRQEDVGIYITGNPIIDPPPGIIQLGKEAIINYFERLNVEKTEKLFEAKLLILGEGGAGKTTLVNKLSGGINAAMPDEKDTTKGIEVNSKSFKTQEGKNFKMNIWDFGGQEIYHSTHQFFLTESSLYILLTDNRKEDTDFNYWLQIIDLLSKQSPVIIVQNKRGGRIKDINKNALISRYPNIKEVIDLDLLNDAAGLKKLNDAIEYHIQQLQHVGKDFFITWLKIRKEIEKIARNKNYISSDAYYEIAGGFNEDFNNASQLSSYLHNLGVFLYFKDVPGLDQTIFLNSNWVTKGVYEILDSEAVTKRKGHFTAADLTQAFSDNSFFQKKIQLIELMKQFQLCYEIADNPGNYITPHLLPANEPAYNWSDADNLQLQYVYDFRPKGIMGRLIVNLHYLITDTINELWRTGAIFHKNNTEAKVIEAIDGRNINIAVKGMHKRDLLVILSDALDVINSKFHDLKVVKKVPCICSVCKGNSTPYFFEYDKLLNRQEKNRTDIECEISFEKVMVSSLLENIDARHVKKTGDDLLKYEMGSLKTFISYSKFDGEETKDINYLKEFKTALSPLIKHNKLIEAWDDTKLMPGDTWDEKIKQQLEKSDIIFLLVSSDFLDTAYIMDTELKIAFEREQRGECLVIPVIIRTCAWPDIGWLPSLNAIPRKGHSIGSWKNKWASKDEAWNEVYNEIKKTVEDFKNSK